MARIHLVAEEQDDSLTTHPASVAAVAEQAQHISLILENLDKQYTSLEKNLDKQYTSLEKQNSPLVVNHAIVDNDDIRQLKDFSTRHYKQTAIDQCNLKEWQSFYNLCLYINNMQQLLNYLYKQMRNIVNTCTNPLDGDAIQDLKPYLPTFSAPLNTLNIPPLFQNNQNNAVTTLIDHPELLVQHFNAYRGACNTYLQNTINTLDEGMEHCFSNTSVTWDAVKISGLFGWPGLLLACCGIAFLASAAAASPVLAVLTACGIAVGGFLFAVHYQAMRRHKMEMSKLEALNQAITKCDPVKTTINNQFLSVEKEFLKDRSVNNSGSSGLFSTNNQAKKSDNQINRSLYPPLLPPTY